MIFTQEIKDAYGKDVRQYPAVVTIPPNVSQNTFPNNIGYLHDLHNNYPLLKDFRTNTPLEFKTEAIFYHPVRKKWIIWANSVCDARYQMNGTIACTQHNLKLAFSPNEYEFIDPKQMLYPLDQIPVFNGMNLPVLPIKTEYADLLDLTRPIQISEPQGTQYKISIPLLGTTRTLDVTFNSISNLDSVDVFLEVWPNLPNWKTYWITSRFINTDPNSGELIGFNRDWNVDYFACDPVNPLIIKKVEEKSWRSYNKDIREALVSTPITEWPELISVYSGAAKGCLIYNPKPIAMVPNSSVGVIGLDFGTARSVVCIADDGDANMPGSFEKYVNDSYQSNQKHPTFRNESHLNPFKHRAKKIIGSDRNAINGLRSGDYFAPITSHKQFNPKQSPSHPKILIVETGLKQLKNSLQQNHVAKVPFNHFTLPMMSEGDPVTDEGSAYNSGVTQVDKWLKSPTDHTQNFLKELLCVTLAEYWSTYPQSTATLLCSTPLAFSLENHTTFRENLLAAKEWLEKEVLPNSNAVLAWNGNTYPESVAAYTAAALRPIGIKDSLTVVADLGGGTLDVSIWYEKTGATAKKILLSDSVQLGAVRMFKCLKTLTGANAGLLDGDIYRFGYSKIQTARNIPGVYWGNFKEKVDLWLKLNMAYIARSILGTHIHQKKTNTTYDLGSVNVLLAGGGWKTCEALDYTPDQLEKVLTKELQEQILSLDKSFKFTVGVFSSLHRCGLEKVAIAGGLHNVTKITNIPNGLRAPNGIDEINAQNQDILWTTFVEETEPWLGVSPKAITVDGEPSLSPLILNIPMEYQQFDQTKLMMIQNTIQASRTAQGGRRRTLSAVVFEQILSNMLS